MQATVIERRAPNLGSTAAPSSCHAPTHAASWRRTSTLSGHRHDHRKQLHAPLGKVHHLKMKSVGGEWGMTRFRNVCFKREWKVRLD